MNECSFSASLFCVFCLYIQKHKHQGKKYKEVFLGSGIGPVREANKLTPSVSRLSTQCAIPNIAEPYRPPRPVAEIALLFHT
jgi:hypothetical protein